MVLKYAQCEKGDNCRGWVNSRERLSVNVYKNLMGYTKKKRERKGEGRNLRAEEKARRRQGQARELKGESEEVASIRREMGRARQEREPVRPGARVVANEQG